VGVGYSLGVAVCCGSELFNEHNKKTAYNALEHLFDIFHLIRKILGTTVKIHIRCEQKKSGALAGIRTTISR
jgi:hypothetical protein